MMKHVFLLVVAPLIFVSCSSGSKNDDKPSSEKTAAVMPAQKPTQDAILQKYSIQELNSAANALKVIADEEKMKDLLGCPITSQQALSMMMPLKALIDEKVRTEVEGYEADPKGYSSAEGFESCTKICACGVFSDIVGSANERKLPQGSGVVHKRNESKLRAKAERQSSDVSLMCAKRQAWFCSSDLHKFLDKGASETP